MNHIQLLGMIQLANHKGTMVGMGKICAFNDEDYVNAIAGEITRDTKQMLPIPYEGKPTDAVEVLLEQMDDPIMAFAVDSQSLEKHLGEIGHWGPQKFGTQLYSRDGRFYHCLYRPSRTFE